MTCITNRIYCHANDDYNVDDNTLLTDQLRHTAYICKILGTLYEHPICNIHSLRNAVDLLPIAVCSTYVSCSKSSF